MYASTLWFAALIQWKPNEFLRAPSGTGGGTRNNNQTGSSTWNGTQGQESTTTESSQTVELSLTEWQGKIDQASEALKTQQQDFEKTQEVFEHLLVRGNPVKMDFKDMTAVEIADAIKNAEGQYVSEAFVEISDTNKVFANYLMMEEISLLTAINKLWWIDNVEAEADVAKKLIYLATAIDVTIS